MGIELSNPIPRFETAEDYWRFVLLAAIAYAIWHIWQEQMELNRNLRLISRQISTGSVTVEIERDDEDDEDDEEE